MPTKCCWVIHGSLTSEHKASTSPSSFINHSTLLLHRALKRQAPCLYICMHFEVRALDRLVRTRRRVRSTRRRGNHMHDHWRFQRDINDVTGVSLSLSLPLTKVTDAQYRKRFRASYNIRKQAKKKRKWERVWKIWRRRCRQSRRAAKLPKNGLRWSQNSQLFEPETVLDIQRKVNWVASSLFFEESNLECWGKR